LLYFLFKAGLSGVLVAIVSTVARRYPGFGGLVASLPLVSVLAMIWLWTEAPDRDRMAAQATATFWFVLPSQPMFLLIPLMLKRGVGFWPALAMGCALSMGLYLAMLWIGPRLGLKL
jgi:hypothetical protein